MNAWEKLLAASQLTTGSAWDLLSNPKQGGAGLVINDGVAVEVAEMPVEVEVLLEQIEVALGDNTVIVEIEDREVEVEVIE